jgi:hypothetical protein
MTQTPTQLVRAQKLDKFYTNDTTVDKCMNILYSKFDYSDFDLTIEPSAGNGAFLKKIIGRYQAFDIEPESENITKMDFFNYKPDNELNKILVVGNPPFGKCSSLAVKFFNHSAGFAEVIAFIIPRTFRRISIQNRLDLNFELVEDIELSVNPCCFSVPVSVKCCFQIWKRNKTPRQKIPLNMTHPHFSFVSNGPNDENSQPTPPSTADFAIKAYGGKCGEICEKDLYKLRPKSWHFIKCNSIIDLENLKKNFKSLDYKISNDSARQNSIGRSDLVNLYYKTIES